MPVHPTMHDLDDPPTHDELLSAVGKLKKGKAGGKTGIVPELLLYGRAELYDRINDLIRQV